MPSTDNEGGIPENLFHILLTVIDLRKDPSGGTRSYYVLGTRGIIQAAKEYSTVALAKIGFRDEDFAQFDVRPSAEAESWAHSEGVHVYARAVSGEEFLISIDTTPNNESLCLNKQTKTNDNVEDEGILRLPHGAQFLHYVLQTTIDYNADRTGCVQLAEIEGSYVHRANAWTAAHRCLDKDRAQFAEYDSRGDAEFSGEWPFDEDVAVHAVAETGQNFFVAVKVPPHVDSKSRAELGRVLERQKSGGEAKNQETKA